MIELRWRSGVVATAGTVTDDATGATFLLPGALALSAVDAVRVRRGLEQLAEAVAPWRQRWSSYARCWRRRDWARGRQIALRFGRRHVCRSAWHAALIAGRITAPLALATWIVAMVAFLPVYVAGGFPSAIPLGCLATATLVWCSVAFHELAHALVALAHRRTAYLERQLLTPSVLVRAVPGVWGATHAAAGPLAGTVTCLVAGSVLDGQRLGLIAPAIALVHLSNLSRAASDGRYLRAVVRRRLRAPRPVMIELDELVDRAPPAEPAVSVPPH